MWILKLCTKQETSESSMGSDTTLSDLINYSEITISILTKQHLQIPFTNMWVPLEIPQDHYAEALQLCFWNVLTHADDFFWLAPTHPAGYLILLITKTDVNQEIARRGK